MAEDVQSKIDEQVKNNRVMVFMKGTPNFPQCGFSAHTVEILRSYDAQFESYDVLSDPGETRDVADEFGEELERHRALLERYVADAPRRDAGNYNRAHERGI